MNDRHRFAAVSLNTIVFASLLSGCGSYDDPKKGTGGTSGSTAMGGSSGTTATGGSSGTTPTGGASGSGQSGSGGSGPTGGSGGGGAAGASGGSGGQVSCTDAAPCGGDVVGTWTAAPCMLTVSGMADLGSVGLGCAMVPVTGSLQVSGTWTAVAGGTYMDNTTTTGQEVLELPAACLMISGTMTSCDRIGLEPIGINSVACIDNAATGGCTCTATINQSGGIGFVSLNAASSGTYTMAENKLLINAFGVDTEYSYCVAGSTLTMQPTSGSQAGPTTGPIVLQKQ